MVIDPKVRAAWLSECAKADSEIDESCKVKRPYNPLTGSKIARNKQYQKKYREKHHDEILARRRAKEYKKPHPVCKLKAAQ